MNFAYRRTYRGPLQALVLDWAGTLVDFGSFAPTAVFLRLFAEQGVPITAAEARSGMGLKKRDHLALIVGLPAVAQRWREVHGSAPAREELDRLFTAFVPMQIECIKEYATPIPGMLETIADARQRGLKIGTTTGYTRPIMEDLLPAAAAHGFVPDSCVCSDEVPAGRPAPWMSYRVATELGVFPMEALVKVGDTLVDIEEGLKPGMWTVGIALTGNLLGLTEPEVASLTPDELRTRRAAIAAQFHQAGAHYVIDSIAALPALLASIEARLQVGEKP